MKTRSSPSDYEFGGSLTGGKNDTYGTVFDSLLKSETFIQLSPPAKNLYVCCRNQLISKEGRRCLHKHGEETSVNYPSGCFVFPAAQQRLYGWNDTGNFHRYMNELIEAGFIQKYEGNKHRWKVTVYKMDTRWRKPMQ